ncbi:glycosyl transferase [Rhizobium sp.]
MASDRPFRRQAIKLAAQVFLGRRRAHYHAWLPSLRIEGRSGDRPGRVLYRRMPVIDLSDIGALTGRAGSRIVIVGSGPSVNEARLDQLSPHTCLLLNGAISLIGQGIAESLAVAIEDERFVWRHFDMIARHVPMDVPMLLSPGVIRALCDIDAAFLKGRIVALIDDIKKPYGHVRRDDTALAKLDFATLRGGAGFSTRPDGGVFQGGSVLVSALQFAMATGARKIGFIGVDITNADAPRFYEDDGGAAFSGVAGAAGRILDHIALAGDIADYRGIRLINHSKQSALNTIGIDYEPLGTSAR